MLGSISPALATFRGPPRHQLYNGATEAEVLAGTRNTIGHWARHGLAGRAVLLDTQRALRAAGRPSCGGWPIGSPANAVAIR